ncbi:Sirohydrochlorin cobaltochelatase [Planctomycetes bacterium CA13]|uniref:Sirohydrochlorin cobaltochelatase n=1 Tax=Novipirellula herctigrandis TaxID=2527986 RepID=A0A5C5Z0M8_9BACT|nr:Sirohydrochlorin cobaltochelatase [Planctomycetes bacterium CA13]
MKDQYRGVLLVGHGTRDTKGTAQFFELTEQLRNQLPTVAVEPCLLEFQSPTIPDAWNRLVEQGVTMVRVAPLLLFAAGHAKRDIPDAVEKCRVGTPNVSCSQTLPISRHPEIVELVVSRLSESLNRMDTPRDRVSLVMVGRGSYDPCATADMRVLSEIVASRLGMQNRTTAFYAMADPRLPSVLEAIARLDQNDAILVHPHLLFDGRLYQAIGKQVGEIRSAFPEKDVYLSSYLGPDVGVAKAIAGRIMERPRPQILGS